MTVAGALVTASPLLLLLGLMLVAGWSAARAALAGLALGVVLVPTVFAPAGGLPALLPGVVAESLFQGGSILWILLPAMALYLHQREAGSFERLREALAGIAPAPGVQVLLLGWFLALFLEGAAGFGTPAAIVAPLLVALGLPPVQAVVIALIGHAGGVVFGALGTPLLAQAGLTGLDPASLATPTALLNATAAAVLMGAFAHGLRTAALPSGMAGLPLRWAGFGLLAFVLAQIGLAATVGPETATLGAATLGLGLTVALLRWRTAPRAGGPPPSSLLRTLAPYLALLVLVLVTRSLPGLREALAGLEWRWQLDGGFDGALNPVLHPGTLLLAALLIGCRTQGLPLASLRPALTEAARRLLPVALALIAMLALSQLMLHAGMIEDLQQALVASLGGAWPWAAPALGALGSFVTGSATASNLLFAPLQLDTAQALGLPPAWILAGQGVGAAVGNIVCPHNVVAAAATVGLAGREAELLRRLLPAFLGAVLLVGAALAVPLGGAG